MRPFEPLSSGGHEQTDAVTVFVSTFKNELSLGFIPMRRLLPDDPFVSLDGTIPPSPSYFSHCVRLSDMAGPSNGLEMQGE